MFDNVNFKLLNSIEENALKLSGLTYGEAFAIDSTDLSKKIDESTITKLTQIFFENIYEDQNVWFRFNKTERFSIKYFVLANFFQIFIILFSY
jgi:hypothetical protein